MATKTTHELKVSLPSDREILMTRTFDAPREIVFEVMLDPELIPRWWGPRKYTTTVEKMDVRPGGAWRFVNHSREGDHFGFEGVYREIVAPERLVYTFGFDGAPGEPGLVTTTLVERDGVTEMRELSRFDSAASRDGVLQSGMEDGARETLERLAELLAERTA